MQINAPSQAILVVPLKLEAVNDWLMDAGNEIVEINSAIDEAASCAAELGEAYVVIKVTR